MAFGRRGTWTKQPGRPVALARGRALASRFDFFTNFANQDCLIDAGPGGRPIVSTLTGGYTSTKEADGITSSGSGYLDTTSVPAGNYVSTPFFLALKITFGASGGNGCLVYKGQYNSGSYYLNFESGSLKLINGSPVTETYTNAAPFSAGTTHTIVVNCTPGASGEFWSNGTALSSGGSVNTQVSSTDTLQFLAYNSNQTANQAGTLYWAGCGRGLLSKAEIAALQENEWQVLSKNKKLRRAGTTSVSAPVGLASETDTGQALSPVQVRAAGLASETDTGQALSPVQVRAAGLASETNTALNLSTLYVAGLAVETSSAFALAAKQITAVGLASETDTASALAAIQVIATGLASEADTASARAAIQIIATGLASETDSAFALATTQVSGVGLSAETDSALALAARQILAAGFSSETDTALTLSIIQAISTGLAAEADTSYALSIFQPGATGLASETDSAFALNARQIYAVGRSSETDTSFALSNAQVGTIGLASETDTASALTAKQVRVTGLASETDSAQAPSSSQVQPVGLAVEIDTALARELVIVKSVGLAAELDTAIQLYATIIGQVSVAVEVDRAFTPTPRQDPMYSISTTFGAQITMRSTVYRPLGPLESTLGIRI